MLNIDWEKLQQIPKFKPVESVFNEVCHPKFRIANLMAYYLGNGFILSFSDKQFKIEDLKRIEYGDIGEYALRISFFLNKSELVKCFMIEEKIFEHEPQVLGDNFRIVNNISLEDSFEEVSKQLRSDASKLYYDEGETYKMNNDILVFEKRFIKWGNYEFFFFQDSIKSKMTAFTMTLSEL